jgi:hypothetical protein
MDLRVFQVFHEIVCKMRPQITELYSVTGSF